MKIAFVTPKFIVGGAETYIIQKSRWLIEHGYEIIVMSEGGDLVEKLPIGAKHTIVEGISRMPYEHNPLKLQRILKFISNILLVEHVDVIEAHNVSPILYVAMSYKFHRVPYLLNVLLETVYDSNFELCGLTKFLAHRGLYCTLTQNMHAYIEGRCGTSLFVKILPIPIANPSIVKYNKMSNYVLTVCRLSEEKMYLRFLIKAFGNFISENIENKELYLYIVGDGPLWDEIAILVESVNEKVGFCAIVMKGTVLDQKLEELYENCIAYIGVGTTLLLGASYHKPVVIAGDTTMKDLVGGFWGMQPELDEKSIIASLKYEKYQISFEKAISKIVNDDVFYKEAANKAFSLFQDIYNINKVMKKWESIYKELIVRPYELNLKNYGNYLFIMNICLYPFSFIKKTINKVR